MENIKEFLSQDFSEHEASNNDFTSHVQAHLTKTMNRCAEDTQFSVEEKDFDNENFVWFANCVRNNVFVNPVLNQSRTVRRNLAGVNY